jgi:hypothetical protein
MKTKEFLIKHNGCEFYLANSESGFVKAMFDNTCGILVKYGKWDNPGNDYKAIPVETKIGIQKAFEKIVELAEEITGHDRVYLKSQFYDKPVKIKAFEF